MVGVISPAPLDEQSTAERIGRYVLRRVIGEGGMGVVYEAADLELHRVVALKVLRSDLGPEQTRLLTEARAMARLSHPNVVTIHDVGREGDRTYIVMELVRGVSLRHWLARESRSVSAVVSAFEQAAEGLAAAHRAGLVHRDFKPENVFVAEDGRVLVGDFGLAVGDGAPSEAGSSLAYMAPEQRRGDNIDGRSDQFSFCVALGEAARSTKAPQWLEAIIERGTQSDPASRFESMDAVAHALRVGRRRSHGRRNAWLAIAAALGVVITGAWLAWMTRRDAAVGAACRARDAEIGALWNADARAKVEAVFRATKSPLVEGSWRRTSIALTQYTETWRVAHGRVCAEDVGRDPLAEAAHERKIGCFAARLEILRGITERLARVDGMMLEQIPTMLQLLPPVSVCEDARHIAELPPPPSSEKADAVDAVKKKIVDASTTIAAGRYKEGLGLAEDAFRSADATGYLPALAEAYLWVGVAHGRLGHLRECGHALEQAASTARAGRDRRTEIRAWIQLVHFVGHEGKRYDEGARYAEYARVSLESIPSAFELQAERLSWLRAMLLERKRFDEALATSREELALVELRFGPTHRRTAAALDGLAGVLAGRCRARDAIEPQERACTILEQEHGTPHPQVALCLSNLAALYANLGEHARSVELKERVLTMFERVPGHPNHVAMARRNMVRSLLELNRFDEAASHLEVAAGLSHREADATTILLLRSEVRRRSGKLDEALANATFAVEKADRLEKGEASDIADAAVKARRADALLARAITNLDAGHHGDAAADALQATTLAASAYGEASCKIAEPLRVHADALLARNARGEAASLAERALQVLEQAQVDPLVRARTELALARALPAAAKARAHRLASSARDTAARDSRGKDILARVDAWRLKEP